MREQSEGQSRTRARWINLGEVVLCLAFLALILWPVIAPAPTGNHRSSCLSKVKQQKFALTIYAGDSDDAYPPSQWMDLIHPYTRNDDIFHCSEFEEKQRGAYGFAMGRGVVSAKTSTIRPEAVVVFETSLPNRNAVSDLTTLAFRHGLNRGFLKADEPASAVAFAADGKARFVRPGESLTEAE